MTTTRVTGTDGKQYDVDYDPGIATQGLDAAAQVATIKQAKVTINSVAPVAVTAPPPVVTPPTPVPSSDMATIAAKLGYASSRLKWNEQFVGTALDSSSWIPQIADQNGIWRKTLPAPLSASDAGGVNAEYYDPANVVVNNGLQLIAKPSTAQAGYQFSSGCICTHGKKTFSSGLILVKMQASDARTGMWNCAWMLEGGPEIDIQEGGNLLGSVSPNNVLAANLHNGSAQKKVDTGVDLSAGYHVYGVDYQPGKSLTFTLDGVFMASYTSGVPTGAYTLILNLQVANAKAAGWHTVYGPNTPNPSIMRVAGVQWYQ